uniref:C-C motif chemokine n=1 Tax=Sphenodon punctatus TaxID=8508 RepID=A0A8D0GD26_SPHPU
MTSFMCKNLVLATLIGLLMLYLSGTCEAQSNQDCCLSYRRRKLPLHVIKGYTEQLSSEFCDINAIIFHTKRGMKVCVNQKDQWVKNHLRQLSKRLKKMSE